MHGSPPDPNGHCPSRRTGRITPSSSATYGVQTNARRLRFASGSWHNVPSGHPGAHQSHKVPTAKPGAGKSGGLQLLAPSAPTIVATPFPATDQATGAAIGRGTLQRAPSEGVPNNEHTRYQRLQTCQACHSTIMPHSVDQGSGTGAHNTAAMTDCLVDALFSQRQRVAAIGRPERQ